MTFQKTEIIKAVTKEYEGPTEKRTMTYRATEGG